METVKLYISVSEWKIIRTAVGQGCHDAVRPLIDKIEAQVKAQTEQTDPRAVADPDKGAAVMTGTDHS